MYWCICAGLDAARVMRRNPLVLDVSYPGGFRNEVLFTVAWLVAGRNGTTKMTQAFPILCSRKTPESQSLRPHRGNKNACLMRTDRQAGNDFRIAGIRAPRWDL